MVMTMHPAPAQNTARWKLTICSVRVAANDPLAGLKSCSRLLQVLAASEARARQVDEAILVNTNGEITEGSTSNVFWIEDGVVCTPPLSAGVLPGVTRGVIVEICNTLGIPHREKSISPNQLAQVDGVFLSLTSRGVVEAESIDGKALGQSLVTGQLQKKVKEWIARECC